jgi:two-component system CheB/CheR fusion protein
VWVPGCATGEEAYSIAMVLLEEAAAVGVKIPVKIFASDLDREALKIARAGIYPEGIALDVPPRQLQGFFRQTDQTYRINNEVRALITFTVQNLVTDPPYSKLDLIDCQNFLGHIEPELQRRVVQSFAFALKPGGYLRLARSDVMEVDSLGDRFEAVSTDMRIYRRIAPASSYMPVRANADAPKRKSISSARPAPTGRPRKRAVEREASIVGRLEDELKFTKDDSHLTVYDYEASLEELRAANEEINTINEELRLANEELESSHAELRAANEKLNTVNNQLTLNIEELNRVNDDLTNFLDASDIATVILDSDLHIKRFTPSARKLFNFVPTDLGRPLEHISNKLLDKNILSFYQRVFDYSIPLQ